MSDHFQYSFEIPTIPRGDFSGMTPSKRLLHCIDHTIYLLDSIYDHGKGVIPLITPLPGTKVTVTLPGELSDTVLEQLAHAGYICAQRPHSNYDLSDKAAE